MLTGKKYRYGSSLWRIMVLAQIGVMPAAYANPGDGLLAAGAPTIPHMPSFPDAAGKAAAVHIHPELAKAARAYHAQYQTLPDMKAINAKAAVMTQISAAGDAIKHGLKTPDLGKMNPFTSKAIKAMFMRELPKAVQARIEERARKNKPGTNPENSSYNIDGLRVEQMNDTTLVYAFPRENESGSIRRRIEWERFNVDEGHKVIVRQTPGSVLLNTVTGTDKSVIAGLVDVNTGHAWISNPNGFDLKDTAKIGADLITTKITTDENFLAKTILFEGSLLDNGSSEIKVGKVEFATPGKWVNLVASNVSQDANTLLAVPSHQTTISNAQVFTIDPDGDGMITTAVDLKRLSPEVREQIMAQAASGDKDSWVVMGSDDLVHAFKGAISMNGVVEASNAEVDAKSGSIRLMGDNVTVTGKLSATGQGTEGGTVYVTGRNVNVGSKVHIDVSGDTGAGKIAVGGANTKGYDPEAGKLPKAKHTTIAEGVVLEASARVNGPAGIVNTWADDLNKDGSTIVAKGGPKEGPKPNDGPKIERSAAEVLDVTGSKFDVEAGPGGASAEITFDPANITLTTLNANAAPGIAFSVTDLGTAIGAGAVTISTETPENAPVSVAGSNATGGGWLAAGSGTMTIAAPIDISARTGGYALILSAGGTFTQSDSLTLGSRAVTLRSTGGSLVLNANITSTSGSLTVQANANGGALTVGNSARIVLGSATGTFETYSALDISNASQFVLGSGNLYLKSTTETYNGVTADKFSLTPGGGSVMRWIGGAYQVLFAPPPAPPVAIPGGGIVPPGATPDQAIALANINRNGLPSLGYIGGSGYMSGVGPMLTGPIAPPPGGMLGPVGPMPISGPSSQGGGGGPVGPMGPVGPVPGYSNISIVNAPAPMGMGMPSGMPMMSIGAPTALAGPSMASLGSYGLSFAPTPPPSGRVGVYGGMPGTPPPGGPLGPVPTSGGILGAPAGPGDTRGMKVSTDGTVEPGSTSQGTSKLGVEPKGAGDLTPPSQATPVIPSTAAGG